MSDVGRYFQKGSDLNQLLDGFEVRPGQAALAEAVAHSIAAKEILLVEAGTGTGKTIAYLLPLILHAKSAGKRVVVSTETKALQNQILNQDLPIVSRLLESLNLTVTSELCLGSANYLCKRKFQQLQHRSRREMAGSTSGWMNDFRKWESRTKTGILSQYTGYVAPGFLQNVARESDRCLGAKCPNYSVSHYFVAKERWQKADLLIVNHALLARHLLNDGNLLPDFDAVVIDEAHHFAEIFNAQAETTLSFQWLKSVIAELSFDTTDLEDSLAEFRTELAGRLQSQNSQLRLTQKIKSDQLNSLIDLLHEAITTVNESNDDDLFADHSVESDLQRKSLKGRLEEAAHLLDKLCDDPTKDEVFSLTSQPHDLSLTISPLDSMGKINELFLNTIDSIVFTSATLTTNQSFDYFDRQTGIEQHEHTDRFKRLIFESPFDYRSNSLLYIPRNLPEPQGFDTSFDTACIDQIRKLIELSKGGVLVVFSSQRSMRIVESGMTGIRYPIFSTTDGGPQRALHRFHETENSVLFGLESFRQGLDIRGDKLRMVILVRLPFAPLTDPLFEARDQREKASGRNSFMTLQLPTMIMKMRQGFGRLIRSSKDKGVVAILDPRIYSRPYGKTLLSSLPKARQTDSFDELQDWWLHRF